jgi:PAS domain S-box-containing protein
MGKPNKAMAFNSGTDNRWFYFLFKKRLPISLYIIIPFVVALIAFSSGFIALVLVETFFVDNLVLSLAPSLKLEVNTLLRWTRLEIVGFTLLGAIAGIGIVYAILNPLRKILLGARQIAEGDFSGRLDVKGLDELGILGKDFNLMVTSLNEYFIDSLAGGWILFDPQGKIVSVNRGALNILQCDLEGLIGKPHSILLKVLSIDSILGVWIRDSVQNQMERSLKELEAVNAEGRSLKLTFSTSRLKDKNNNFAGMAMTLKDLTRASEITEKMQRADKLAALGGMAAGLAHEIRNPLGSIKGLTQLLDEEFSEGTQARTYTQTMIREIDRINGVVTNLLNFSQPTQSNFHFCNINKLLEQALSLVKLSMDKKQIRLTKAMDPNLPAHWGDGEKLVQAFLNLLLNAVQAVNEAGEIVLVTAFDPNRLINKMGITKGMINIQIKNSGDPIPSEIISNLFDPFFTTKKDGTGLGLPITHQIVTLHGGNLILSRSNGFTEFNIELPMADPSQTTTKNLEIGLRDENDC